jgi:RHS repeat-associated protein
LPDTIQFGNGRQIINSYDAGGHKLTTQYYTPIGTVIITQGNIHGSYTTANSVLLLDDYCGSYLYENGTSASVHPLTKILTPEGYIDMSTSGYPYCYFKQDHLGSNREVTSYAGTTGTVVQQTEYYPSGTAYVEGTGAGIQPFKFTGKELIIMHGLNWQDYGARWLDNVRMQWTTMDPLCEKYYAISPYTYCSDDPAKNIDPDGKDDIFDLQGNMIRHINNNTNNILIQDKNLEKNLVSYNYSSENKNNRTMLANVGTYYAQKADLNQKIGVVDVAKPGAFASTNNATLQVNIDVDQNGRINSLAENSYNVINSFSHEENHVENPSDMGTSKGEINAIMSQASHSSFGRTTENFQAAVLNYAVNNLNDELKGKSSITQEQTQIRNLNTLFSGVGTLSYDTESNTVIANYDYLKEVQCIAPVINK